ncbi:MAG: starch-binding protein, partial [Ruminococcus sp.]
MSGIKKALALVLALIMMIAIGAVSASAVDISKDDSVAADEPLNITLHVMQDGLAQPYVYLWNSLPTNSAMSQAYPGEKMNLTGEWFTYTVRDVTKVNVLITDADGKQYCRETKITSASADWYFFRGRWTKYDPTQVDPAESLDPREDTLYFVMTTRFYDGDSGNNVHCWDDHVANNP